MRVVVRDAQGKPVAGLHLGDFRVLSDRHPESICEFLAEEPRGPQTTRAMAEDRETSQPSAGSPNLPQHFAAFLVDDYHLATQDLPLTREAVDHSVVKALQSGCRVGLFSASGAISVGFTEDHHELSQALAQLRPHSRFLRGGYCPDLTPYHAQKILEGSDPEALRLGVAMTFLCRCRCPTSVDTAVSTAMLISVHSDIAAAHTLQALNQVASRLEDLPGLRTLTIISDGFLMGTHLEEVETLVDRAVRQHISISAFDPHELCSLAATGDTGESGQSLAPRDALAAEKMARRSSEADAEVLSELADGTGGEWVKNSADFNAGLRWSDSPGPSYLLGVSPPSATSSGEFHRIKVTLIDHTHLRVQARHGFYLPRQVQKDEAQSLRLPER